MNIKMFVDQHEELLSIAGDISKHLEVDKLQNETDEVKKLWMNLLGKLSIHLNLEDEWLYPKLLEHSDENVRTMAKKFVDEMGGIGQAVSDYKDKWIITTSAIQQDPNSFIKETNAIFTALANRIDKENNELYKGLEDM